LLALSGRLSEAWYLDAAMRLDISENRPDRQSYTARYSPRPGATLNIGYRHLRGSYEQVDMSGQWPLTERWYGVGRYTYSLLDQRAVTTVAGLEYNADCWLARLVVQEFATFTGVSNRAIYLQVELSGLSSLGSNPLGVLRQNVIGYQRVNTLNQGQYQDDYYPSQ
ncbi:MAG: LPS assembly protein LptD, partial [Betaproteobacteria bacterium]